MEKHSAAHAAETANSINSLVAGCQYGHFITRRVESFCFSASQRKAKKTKALRTLQLCGESIFKMTLLGSTPCHPFGGWLLTSKNIVNKLKRNLTFVGRPESPPAFDKPGCNARKINIRG